MKFPLTISQQGLWYLSQVGHDVSAAYNVVFAFETSSPLDSRNLSKSLHFLMLRHPILGARVCQEDGSPQFEVTSNFAGTGAGALLSSVVGHLAEVALRESGKSFNFEGGPLFRVVLVEDPASTRCGFVVTFAHLVFDGGSLPVFLRDLGFIYAAVKSGNSPEFRDYPLSQEELCRREMEFVDGEEGRSLVERIAARIRNLPESVSLPTKKARNTHRAVPIASAVDLSLPAGTVESIRLFCNSNRISSAAFHLAAFEVLLWHYSQQREFGVSFPVNGRDSSKAALSLGYLSNIGILRAHVMPSAHVLENIMAAADAIFDALEERSVPFPIVVRELKQAGQDLQGPLMQIGFNYQVVAEQLNWQLGDVSIKLVSSPSMYAKNEFKLDVAEAGPDVTCRFIFDQEVFSPSVIERMVSHYSALLTSFVANPQSRVQDLPLLTEAERHQILVEWNDTKADFPQDKCIHQLFEEQVARSPDSVAVVFEDQQLTYAQLNAKANQLAHHLRGLGVKPDTLVAICVERSLEIVVGLLGILKAGGAYVPLDPAYPTERLVFMLQDASPAVLVAQECLAPRLGEFRGPTVLADPTWSRLREYTVANAPCVNASQHLAYCLYTSGSTGLPKGVELTHRNAVNFLTWVLRTFGQRELSQVACTTSVCFDLSVFELFGTLLAGGTVVLQENAMSLLSSHPSDPLTTINTVPSAVATLADASAIPAGLRVINLAGEPLQRSLVNRVFAQAPEVTVFNLYGPTEYTTYTTVARISAESEATITLGRPIANTRIYILNDDLQIVPIGVAGEICIAGEGLARGYLKRPNLTATKFVPNPFDGLGERMYKTGDVGRYLENGEIEFLGRFDHQVKVRGFRVELGEIESVLLDHPSVAEAAVLLRGDGPGDTQLVAYVVPRKASELLTREDLRTHIQRRLPEFMTPKAWIFMDALPLNQNGKVDRRILPAPEPSDLSVGAGRVAPRTSTEKLLADIWAEVLHAGRISIDDNFFVIGGHSLLAAQVIARLRQAGFASVSLRTLLDAPTVRRLAAAVDMLVPSSQSAERGPISRLSRSI